VTTVLVVDDEPIVREVVCSYLRRDGFTTLEAGDGDEARRLFDRGDSSVVVLDVMLPGTGSSSAAGSATGLASP
jgi:DNA-binding response OmpR family regulator